MTIEEFFPSNLDHAVSKYAHFFDKQDKKMVDTLVAIQGGQKWDFFSGAELVTESNETVANT